MPLVRSFAALPLSCLVTLVYGCLATAATAATPSHPARSTANNSVEPQIRVVGAATVVSDDEAGQVAVRLDEASGRATVDFNYPGRGLDLSAFRDIGITTKNSTSSELDVLVTGASDSPNNSRRSTQTRFFVRPGEQIDLVTLMPRPALPRDHPHVRRLGFLYGFPWGHQRHWQNVDASAMRRVTVRIDWLDAEPGQTIRLSHPFGSGYFSTDPAKLDTLELPLVDTLGQGRHADWPGKISDPAELADDAARDLALVASVTRPREGLNQYGGLLDGPRLPATGFFRTEKIDGRWWFVDPEGRLFWSLGVNTAGRSPSTSVTGREELFPESQRDEPELSHHRENLIRKHGPEKWEDRHTDVTLARMMDWGLNTIGAWSDPALAAKQRVPFTLIIHANTPGFGAIDKVPDPYSEDFINSINERIAPHAALYADSPWLLGVFIDNELHWKGHVEMFDAILNSPTSTPARRKLIEFLTERHGTIRALNKAWGTKHSSLRDVEPKPGPSGARAYEKDARDFITIYADAYYAASRAAVKRHFPNHLYLGSRFHVFNPIFLSAAAKHCDVVSANLYRYSVADFSLNTEFDRPVIIGEFHFGIRDYGNWGVGLTWAADARNQSDLVQGYLSEALRNPNIVGAHWFQWANQTPTGRGDGENFGVGLVTVVDRPVEPLVNAFRTVSESLYQFRLAPGPHRIGSPSRP